MDIEESVVRLIHLTLEGKLQDIQSLADKILYRIVRQRPDLESQANRAARLLKKHSPLRSAKPNLPIPMDNDSRLELLRLEENIILPIEPTWPTSVRDTLNTVIAERHFVERLRENGLAPTRSLLLVGPPGVGKTLSARWLARELDRPLLTLDLAAVMSSFLGRTGNNIRVVLEYAQRSPSVLLLDEFDAIAKRRDDITEVGELKRLVTVLLQTIDDWPADGLLLAATNHPELLDPAVWRRFDHILRFPLPDEADIQHLLDNLLSDKPPLSSQEKHILSFIFKDRSFADVTREVKKIQREAVLANASFPEIFYEKQIKNILNFSASERLNIARDLLSVGFSQRRCSEITGVSRDTLRKHRTKKQNSHSLIKPSESDY